MDITYKRNVSTSYMVISGGSPPAGYEERMLRENEIDTLLPFYTVETDGRLCYWYDISGRIALADYLNRTGIATERLKGVFKGIEIALRTLSRYLIAQEHIALSPETVYLTETAGEPIIYLCFFPSAEASGITALTEYLITTVDHSKEREMRLCYDLYEISASAEGTIGALLERIERELENDGDGYGAYKAYEDNRVSDAGFADEVCDDEGYEAQGIRVRREQSDRCIQIHREAALPAKAEKELPVDMKKPNTAGVGLIDRLRELIASVWERITGVLPPLSHRMEAEDIIEATDLVYEPDAMLYEPTVMLSDTVRRCEGRLVYDGGGGSGEDIHIKGERYRIGSMAGDNDAVIASSAVSRHHAVIIYSEGEYYIEDMNSTNGTFVNDRMLAYRESVRLSASDRVRFADVSYRFM